MTATTIADLKSRFERLDRPTQQDFIDLFDTLVSVLGENWPAVLPAASAANLTNLPYDDPLPALDGGRLTNVKPAVWYRFPVTPTWASTSSLLLEGDFADLLHEAVRLTVRYGNDSEQANTLVSATYSAATNLTTVVVGTLLYSTDVAALSTSVVPVWTEFPVVDFSTEGLNALELVRADAAGTALEGVPPGDLAVTDFSPGSATALQLLRVDELGEVIEGADPAVAVADLGQTISATYTQSEVQAISDKVDALLGALRTAGLLASA